MNPTFEALPFEPLFEIIKHLSAVDVLSLKRVSKTMEVVISHFVSSFIRETLKKLYDVPAEHARGITSNVNTLEDLYHCEQTSELARALSEGPCRITSPSERPPDDVHGFPSTRSCRSEDSVS